jgi:hypothetical protein
MVGDKGGAPLKHPLVHAAITHAVSAKDPRAGAILAKAQGHPLTAPQKVALQQAQGKLTPAEAHKHLVKAGVLPKLEVVHDETDPFNKLVSNFLEAGLYSPAGIYYTGKKVAGDVKRASHGDLSFKGSREVGKSVGHSFAEDFRHPLRNPGFTLLDASAVVGGVEGAASRSAAGIGAALTAKQAGRSAIRSALTRAPREGGSLLRKPAPGTRTYRLHDLEVKVPNSTRPLVRAGQKLHAKVLNARPDSDALHTKIGTEIGRNRQVTNAAERAPAAALSHRAKKLTTAQQEAVGVVAEGKPIDERIALHKAEADAAPRGSQRYRDSRQKIATLEAARRYVVDGPDGKPQLAPDFKRTLVGRAAAVVGRGEATPAKLRTAYDASARVAHAREKTLTDAGVLDPAQAEARLHAPGRVIEGAQYRKATPSRLGKSDALGRETRRRDSIQRRLNNELDQETEFLAKQRGRNLGALSEPDARARLASLDHLYVTLVQKLIPETSEYGGKLSKAEQLRRNAENARAGKGKRIGAKRQPTVTQDEFRNAESALHQLIERHGGKGNASVERAAKLVAERDRLRNALNAKAEAAMSGEAPPRLPDAPAEQHASVPQGSNPHRDRIVRLGHVLEEQQRRVDTLTKTVQTKTEPTGLIGAEDFKGGEFRVPYHASEPRRAAGASGYRGAIPKKPGSVTNEYTGALQRSGAYRSDRVRQLAASALEAHTYSDVLHLRDQLLKASIPEPKEGYSPIRVTASAKPIPEVVKRILNRQDAGIRISHDERRALERWSKDWHDEIFPDPAKLAEHKGVRWVPTKLLENANARSLFADALNHSRGADVVDTINNATKLAVLYLKPAYATPNIAGNAFLTLTQQGVFAPANLARSAFLNAKLGEDAAAVLDSVIGEGLAHSLTGGGGALRKGVEVAASVWSKGVDLPFRRAAFIYEARKLGYKGSEQLHELLTNPAHSGDLVEAARRANDALIDYGRLGPNERAIVRRVIFFYPWVKGSTQYAGRLVRDRPIVAAGLAHVAQEGNDHTGLGPVPSYLEGSFKVGDNKLVNPASAAVLGTPAQVVEAIRGLQHGQFKSAADLAGFLTPVLRLAGGEAFRVNSLGNKYPDTAGGKDIAVDQLLKGTPQYRLWKALTHDPNPNAVFPGGSAKEGVEQFVGGSSTPRTYNPEALHAQARSEQRALMSADERDAVDDRDFRVKLTRSLRDQGVKTIPPQLKAALDVRLQRKQALTAAQEKAGHKLSPAERFDADVALLAEMGRMTPDEAEKAQAWGRSARDRDLNSARSYLTRNYFDGKILTETVRYLNQHGADLSSP